MQITSLTNNEIYDNSNRTSSVEKAKSDDFESFIASQKSSTQSNSKTTNIFFSPLSFTVYFS